MQRGLETWICFIDYAKAYDKVPQAGLIEKIKSMRIGGKLLNFIKSLYKNPQMTVRKMINYHLRYHKNVAYDKAAHYHQLYVPGLGLGRWIPGLLFADDALVLAESSDKLQITLDVNTKWSDIHKMTVNAGKCGVMPVNCVNSMDHQQQQAKNKKCNTRCIQFFKKSTYTNSNKTQSATDNTMPICTSGGKLFDNVSKMAVMNRLRTEFDIQSINLVCSRLRERAYFECLSLKTWISNLILYPLKSRSSTWISAVMLSNVPKEQQQTSEMIDLKSHTGSNHDNWLKTHKMQNSSNWISLQLLYSELRMGLQIIVKIRTESYWTTERLAKSQLIAKLYMKKCTFGVTNVSKTLSIYY
ncbi:hypothetical protein BB561_001155 [Smittium simulii]|uniref:Reverse transcriptase domain-containing protein n=1 Tax=Smittium simulii TaxID=133385 RepID=A0A2T9YVW4_9FUNG|nr:hypothetical protein BB561_001155 [Smittium simulii]